MAIEAPVPPVPVERRASDLPAGVQLYALTTHRDQRGVLTEVFREAWDTGVRPVQWNLVRSDPGVVRGVHVHVRHADYLLQLSGWASIGLRDLRPGSPTEGRAALVELHGGEELTVMTIPPGVAHGFYFREPSMQLIGVTTYWDPADELGCDWSDPALGIPWPAKSAVLSARDAALGPLSALAGQIPAWRGA